MNATLPNAIHPVGRFAIAVGAALAVVSAVAFGFGTPQLVSQQVAEAGQPVRLETVVVTISGQSFDAIRTEADSASMVARRTTKAAGA